MKNKYKCYCNSAYSFWLLGDFVSAEGTQKKDHHVGEECEFSNNHFCLPAFLCFVIYNVFANILRGKKSSQCVWQKENIPTKAGEMAHLVTCLACKLDSQNPWEKSWSWWHMLAIRVLGRPRHAEL